MTEEQTGHSDPVTLNAPAPISRREFMRQAGAGVVAAVALGVGGVNLLQGPLPHELQTSSGVIMPDPTLCIGCLTCEVACSRAHRAQGLSDVPRIRIFNDADTVVDSAITQAYGDRGQYHQSPCLMCPEAPCHYACPADALPVEASSGARIIDEDKCIACGRCATACPFPTFAETEATNRLTFNQASRITYDPARNVYTKCDLCYWRPEGPACVGACPVNVRIRQGIIKSDRLCLDAPAATREHWQRQSEMDWQINLSES